LDYILVLGNYLLRRNRNTPSGPREAPSVVGEMRQPGGRSQPDQR